MKRFLLFLLLSPLAWAQCSISVTAPTSNQTISGQFTFTASTSSCTPLYAVNWIVDGDVGYSFLSTSSPYSFVAGAQEGGTNDPQGTFSWWNGVHEVQAVAQDALGNVLASSSVVAFTIQNTWPYNSQADGGVSGTFTTTFSVTPGTSESSPWSGIVSLAGTLGGTYSTSAQGNGSSTYWIVQVDGARYEADLPGTVTSHTINLNTTQYPNGQHFVCYIVGAESLDTYGEWCRSITFSNGTTAMALQASANSTTVGAELFLCVTSATNCPSSVTLTGVIVNTDGSTSAASSPTFSAAAPNNAQNQTSVCSVGSSSGVVTVSATGMCVITMSASGFTRTIWVHVFTSANVLPHFEKNGSISTSQSDANSVWMSSVFNSGAVSATLSTTNQAPQYASGTQTNVFGIDMKNAGYLAIEINPCECSESSSNCGGGGGFSSQSAYQASQTSYTNSWISYVQPYGLYIHGFFDGYLRSSQALWNATQGQGTAWTPLNAVEYCWNTWVGQPIIGADGVDEVNTLFGFEPQNNPTIGQSGGVSSLVVSGSTGTVNWTNYDVTGSGAGNTFIITGATSSGLNTPVGTILTLSKVNNNQFTFTFSGTSPANGTYNSTTDPNLVVQPYVYQWYGSSYDNWNAFINFMNWTQSVSGRPMVTWPNAGLTNGQSFYNWEGDPRMADYATCYDPSGGNVNYRSSRYAAWGYLDPVYTDLDLQLKNMCSSNMNLNTEPLISQGSALTNDYGIEPYYVSVTSCTNDICTIPSHGLTTVIPGDTRLAISSSSSSSYNTKYYVRSIIDANTLQLTTFFTSSGSGTGGTLTFQDGTQYSIGGGTLSTHTSGAGVSGIMSVGPNTDTSCTLFSHIGETASVTGSSYTAMNGVTFWVPLNNPHHGTSSLYTNFCSSLAGYPTVSIMAIPSGSTTGGTAAIFQDNNLHKGQQLHYGTQGNAMGYAAAMTAVVNGAAGVRAYEMGQNQDGFDLVSGNFNAQSDSDVQKFTGDPRSDSNQVGFLATIDPLRGPWFGQASAQQLIQRLVPYLYGARMASPDYGANWRTSARTNSRGNILIIQSYAESPQQITVNLSPYLTSGQAILRYLGNWQGGPAVTRTTAGTTSDTPMIPPDGTVVYLFPQNAAAEWSAPVIPTGIAAVSGATQTAVRWSYGDPYFLSGAQATGVLTNNLYNCGSSSMCAIPADGTISRALYYQLTYLNASNAVVSQGPVLPLLTPATDQGLKPGGATIQSTSDGTYVRATSDPGMRRRTTQGSGRWAP